ncbi:MAG TPA: NADH:ubiquinone oxidoreductase [Bacteroidales bacterium]|nr:NADH:ubiquinone oxidoreductase [Bacteroidales bacterium]HPS62082.1 NADH:ubiquinone oxidoreductase [Bacteroidales bacterium]
MPLREFNILRDHGKQYVPDLRRATLPEIFRGRPVISGDILPLEAEMAASICPSGAIQTRTGSGAGPVCSLDLGKCLFCRECEFALPGKIRFTHDHRLAANDRQSLVILPGEDKQIALDPARIRKEIRSLYRHALKLRQVSAGGDNSAEMELNAAGNVNFDMGRYGIEFVASPRHADGIVITGPITVNMAKALRLTWEAVPPPRVLILVGTDAISGGLFAGSNALDRSFLEDHSPDLLIPGNPPHPLTFINGVLDLTGR